jgi:hypothetical protein
VAKGFEPQTDAERSETDDDYEQAAIALAARLESALGVNWKVTVDL